MIFLRQKIAKTNGIREKLLNLILYKKCVSKIFDEIDSWSHDRSWHSGLAWLLGRVYPYLLGSTIMVIQTYYYEPIFVTLTCCVAQNAKQIISNAIIKNMTCETKPEIRKYLFSKNIFSPCFLSLCIR